MYSIGVIGDIGSGKSTICACLASHGAEVLSADEIGAEIREHPEIKEKIVRTFGVEVLDDEGQIDRKKLAAHVFDCPSHIDMLDDIIIPSIQDELVRRMNEYRLGDGLLAVEIPLVGDSIEMYSLFDGIIRVVAPDELRLSRLTARGMDREDARRRMKRQQDKNVYPVTGAVVIENTNTIEELDARLMSWLRARGFICE
jgi:dephospho-CoA kinase